MTAIAVLYKRKEVAQLNLMYDTKEPNSLSLGVLNVQVNDVQEDLLAGFAYYLTSFPSGKVFISLERLNPALKEKQVITYEDLIVILQAFPEGWSYQGSDIPILSKPDNVKEKLYEQFGVMGY
jgi:hypothetical protein